MKIFAPLGFWVFYAAVHPAILVTGLLCGVVVCLFHWGQQFELSILNKLQAVSD